MATKRIMRKAKTNELLATVAKTDGVVYKKYLRDGYKPIGFVSGFDVQVWGLD